MVGKLGILVQAHMGSTRLKDKMMRDLHGRSVIGCVVTRLQQVRNADALVVATSSLPADDVLVEELRRYRVDTFRGSDSDVLQRFYEAAQYYGLTDVVRVCADNTLVDPEILEQQIACYRGGDYKVVVCGSHIPLGLGGEIFSFKLLEEAARNATEPYQHEHVTPYIYEHHNEVHKYDIKEDCSKYRFTLDTEEDWHLIYNIYDVLKDRIKEFRLSDVVEVMGKHPDWIEINKGVKQRRVK